MRKLPPVALVATGKLMRSFLLDLPGFRDRIGPVKAGSLRVASRIVNNLRAGVPTADSSAFDGCRAIYICVPDGVVRATVNELADSPLDWAGRMVVLCDSSLASDALRSLAALGAITASLTAVPGLNRMVLADGHPTALSNLKAVIGRSGRLLRIRPEQKARYYRGLAIASLSGPLAALAGEQLCDSGLTAAQAKPVVNAIFSESVRDYLKSGRKILSNSSGDADLVRKILSAADL